MNELKGWKRALQNLWPAGMHFPAEKKTQATTSGSTNEPSVSYKAEKNGCVWNSFGANPLKHLALQTVFTPPCVHPPGHH